MERLRQQLALAALREARFLPALGIRTLGWYRFVRRLRRRGLQDVAVLRLERRTRGAIPYYVWLTYPIDRSSRGRIVPGRIYLPDDTDPEILRGMPPQLEGLAFYAPGSGEITGYTAGMTSKMGPKGQVVIPKELRDKLGIRPGDVVTCSLADGGVLVQPVGSLEAWRGRFAGLGLTDLLEEEHRRELERE